jgi:hypothetical protein
VVAAIAWLLLAPLGLAQVWEVGEVGLVFSNGPQSGGQFGQVTVSGDFNGDGYLDLAVGAPFFDSTSPAIEDVGRVQVHLGSSQGLSATPVVTYEGSVAEMHVGTALAAGDFDADFGEELVFGAPGLLISGFAEAGRVFVVDHSGGGWNLSFWDQETTGVPGAAEDGDRLGEVLATGDYDDDGFSDLAIGMPHEDLLLADSGALLVLYGSSTGLSATGAQLILQDDVAPPEQAGASMGRALAAGDFDGDDLFWDLAIGFPGFDIAGQVNAGGVAILFGGASGLSTAGAQLIDDADVGGAIVAGDGFGTALAAGDFDRTPACWPVFACRTDLAIGVPGEDVGGAGDAGLLVVGYGGSGGIQVGGADRFDQGDLPPAASGPETDDRFGSVLWSEWVEAAHLDGPSGVGGVPSADDLVVGVPGEAWMSTSFQGIVHLVFGSGTGLNANPGQYLLAVPGYSSAPAAAFDNFGYAVAVGDFDDDGWADLAAGVVGRDAGAPNAGMVQVLYGALFADGFESQTTANW